MVIWRQSEKHERRDSPFDLASKDDLLSDIKYLISIVEKHEREEWLKVDGVRLHDPHTNLNFQGAL